MVHLAVEGVSALLDSVPDAVERLQSLKDAASSIGPETHKYLDQIGVIEQNWGYLFPLVWSFCCIGLH